MYNVKEITRERSFDISELYNAIENNGYAAILAALEKPYLDINQTSSLDIEITQHSTGDKLRLRSGWTLTAHAIQLGKPILVELFLLMGANPFGGHADNNPIHLIPRDSAHYEQIKQLLRQYQYPEENSSAKTVRAIFDGPFIEALTKGDATTVARMLSEDTIYTDQCCHNIYEMAFTLAVKSKSFATVALLVERGATITDPAAQTFLQNHANEAWCKSISQLIALEKSKQLAIMKLFCVAEGNLELCRKDINQIRQQYQSQVQDLREGKNTSVRSWEDYDAMNSIVATIPPIPAMRVGQPITLSDDGGTPPRSVTPSSTPPYSYSNTQASTLFSQPQRPMPSANNLNGMASAAVLFLSVGGGITTVGLGVLLHNPHFALFAIPQLPAIAVGMITAIGMLMLASGLLLSCKAYNESSSSIETQTDSLFSQQSP